MAELIASLLEQHSDKGLLERFNASHAAKKRQIERLYTFNQQLGTEKFKLADIVREFKNKNLGDPSRDLKLLQQAGLLKRKEIEGGQIEYTKAVTDEKEIVATLVRNAAKIKGYIPSSRRKPEQAAAGASTGAGASAGQPESKPPVAPRGNGGQQTGLFTDVTAEMEVGFSKYRELFPNTADPDTFKKLFMKEKAAGI